MVKYDGTSCALATISGPHLPMLQAAPPVHAWLQAPQLRASFWKFMHAPEHAVVPAGQAQTFEAQAAPALQAGAAAQQACPISPHTGAGRSGVTSRPGPSSGAASRGMASEMAASGRGACVSV